MRAPFPTTADPDDRLQRRLAAAASVLVVLLLVALLRHALHGTGQPFASKAYPLRLHLLSVVPALLLGIVVMARPKGGRTHRLLGRCWAVLMLAAAASGLALGRNWSPIHLLSLLTLVALPLGVLAAMRGNVRAHRRTLSILFASLVVAGFFTLLPARLLGGWLFGAT